VIAFSTVAMLTILAGPSGAWAAREPAATIMPIAWRFSGPSYVVLGALSMLAFLGAKVGWPRAVAVAAAACAISLVAELVGTGTGLPFGDYRYTPLLGYRIGGRVPFPIPLSWFYMVTASIAIVARFGPATRRPRSAWMTSAIAGLVLLAWDVAMDPAMVHTGHWLWGNGGWLRDIHPAGLAALFTRDAWYGMPLSNWFGWYVTGTVIARVVLAIIPPLDVDRYLAPSAYPVLLYAANGVMPVALCFRDRLAGAAWGGALLMALPLLLLLVTPRRRTSLGLDAAPRRGGA
jgi:uncharacterized membrane protein